MKALKFTLVKTIVAVSLLIGLSNLALARPNVYIGVGIGHPGYGFYHHPYYFGPPWRCYYPYRGTIIVGDGYWYDWGPDYYVVTPPTVVEQVPIVVEKQPVMVSTSSPQVVQPQQFDESTLQLNMNLQYKKSELLKQLQAPNKEQRREAIDELAGFSFDDNVRQALQNVLLSDPNPELRAEAAHSFGIVKNTGARAALEKARVEDPSADVRRAADEAIKSIAGN